MDKLKLSEIEGKWYIHFTNFPMWLKGNKSCPTFNYTEIQKKGKNALFDEVQYIQNGKQRSIKGYDFPLNRQNTDFEWRGKGLLALLKSKWQIIYLNPSKEWGIIHFDKTLFTPEGYDVISRSDSIDKKTYENIKTKLESLQGMPQLNQIEQN